MGKGKLQPSGEMQEVPFRGPYGPYVFVCRGPSLSEHFCPILLLDITETANFRQIETKQWPKKQRSPSIHVVFSPGFMVMEVMPHGLMGVVKHKIFIHCPRRKRMEALTYCCMMK